jgi:uncharacterized protein (TIGR01244 family)
MRKSLTRILLCTLLAISGLQGFAQADIADLGSIDFPTSGSPAAQELFERGVLLLHSFEYEDARQAFQEAQKIDADFAMAYWGEAMTHNHPLWRQRSRDAAMAVLNRLAPTPESRQAKAPTAREKSYLATLEVLYAEGEKLERDLAYEEAMGRLAAKFPEDLEAASFYALSILGTKQGERDFRTYMRAAAIVEEVFDKNPRHPGAAHYLIHSYDDPVHAPLGLRAARVYADIAPAATHAQHMISHIFVALGDWDEVIVANEKSFEVSEERARRQGLPLDRRNHHALHWLQYALLQQGKYEEARTKLEIMQVDAESNDRAGNLWYLAQMSAAQFVQTGEFTPIDIDLDKVGIGGSGAYLYAKARAALRTDDLEAAQQASSDLERRLDEAKEALKTDSSNVYAANSPADLEAIEVVTRQLRGLLEHSQGEHEKGLATLAEAAALQDEMAFDFGPPTIVKPSHELLGELLLEQEDFAAARLEFKAALLRYPRRIQSTLGLARAEMGNDNGEAAALAYAEARSIWSGKDTDLLSAGDLLPYGREPFSGVITGGQPSLKELEIAADFGVSTVINLRMPQEPGTKGEEVEALGMRYLEIPVNGAAGLTVENAQALATALGESDRPVIVHCGSGNRVGALFAIKASRLEGKSPEESLLIGQKAGVTRLEGAVRDLLGLGN